MHTVMDLELLNYINMDMKWNIMKKGRTGMTRRPRKLGEDSFDFDNTVHEPSAFEMKKGIENVFVAPLKKRRLLHQSPSPPPQPPCLNGEVGVSSGPQTPAVNHEDSVQRCRSSSLSQDKKKKSKTRLRKSNIVKPKKNKVVNLDDFSGIELLAAAACSSFVNDSADHVNDLSVSKEQTTPGINSCTVATKEAIILSPEITDSSIQDDMVSHRNKGVEKNVASSKGLRLHWDLNTVMDEWEEPCDDLVFESHSQENCSKSVSLTLDGYRSRCTDAVDVEEKSILDIVYPNQLPVKHDAAISVVPLVGNCNGDSFVETYELIEDLTCPQKVMGIKPQTSKTSDNESSVGKSDVVDSLTHQKKCEDFSTSTTSVLREQTIAKSDQKPVSEKVMQGGCQSPRSYKSSCDNRLNSEDPLSECCGSNVTQDEQGLTAEGDSEEKLEEGYDSPFEDGELRELVDNPYSEKDDVGTVKNTLSEKGDNGQTMENQSSLLVKEAVPNNDIEQGRQAETFRSPDFSERKDGKDESAPFDVCSNGEYVQRIRSSNFGDSCSRSGRESGVEKSTSRDIVMNQFHSRSYNPRGGAYRNQNRRHSPLERNNGYRGPPLRNPHFPPNLNRPQSKSRSRSGSPIAWNFQKRKNLDTCNSGEIESITRDHVSPERSSKYTNDQDGDKIRSPVRMIQRNRRPEPVRYPERLKSDDHFRYTHHSVRFSRMTGPGRDHRYKDNNDAIRKHYSDYEKVNRRYNDGFRRFRDNDSFKHCNRSFSNDSPKEQRLVTPPKSRS